MSKIFYIFAFESKFSYAYLLNVYAKDSENKICFVVGFVPFIRKLYAKSG